MKRKAFVPPRQLNPAGAQQAAAPPAAAPPLSVLDCTFSAAHKKGGAARDGTLVLRGTKAQLFDLELREKAAGTLPAAMAQQLHAAAAAAVAAAAAGAPLGPLWQLGGDEEDEGVQQITVGQWNVSIEDERSAAVAEVEWLLRQRVAAEAAKGGKPKDAIGAAIPLDNAGARMLLSMGWQPGHGLGRTPGARTSPVLPQLKWDKSGLGSSTHVKRLGPQATAFRRASVAGSGKAPAAAAATRTAVGQGGGPALSSSET